MIRTIEREGAEVGLFITLEEPSKPMLLEASTAGVYTSPISGKDYPRMQILSIRQLLEEHAKPILPLLLMPTYQQAERIPAKQAAEQKEVFGDRPRDDRAGAGDALTRPRHRT